MLSYVCETNRVIFFNVRYHLRNKRIMRRTFQKTERQAVRINASGIIWNEKVFLQ